MTRRIDADASWSSQYTRRRSISSRFGGIFRLPLIKRPYCLLADSLRPGADVLEVGAGDRRMKERLEKEFAGLSYQSMDIDACGRHDYTSFDQIRRQFDLVFAFEVAEHIERTAVAPWIDSMARLLKPGGRLALSTPNTYYPPAYLRDITHLTPLCYDELGAILESTGLEVDRICRVYTDAFHRRLMRQYLFGWLFRMIGIDYARQIVISARRPA